MEGIKSMQPANGFLFRRHALRGDECRGERPFAAPYLPKLLLHYINTGYIVALKQVVSLATEVLAIVLPCKSSKFINQREVKSFEELVLAAARMRQLKRKRIEAPRVPTFEDVHPYTTWNMCVRVYHKFHVERFAIYRRRLSMLLLDEKTVVHEMRTVNEQLMPLYHSLMPFNKIWEFTMDNDMYVDVIGMVLYVSSIGFKDSFNNHRIPFSDVCLMDGTFNIVKLVVWDKVLTDSLTSWERSSDERAIIVATMLRAKLIDNALHTTMFSRVHFNPYAAVVHQLWQRINNDLMGLPSPCDKEDAIDRDSLSTEGER